MIKNKLLYEVFKQSHEKDFQKFLEDITDEDGVIDARILFRYKKDHDKMYKEALDRVNNLGKPIDTEKD